jgi:hypothetical protein
MHDNRENSVACDIMEQHKVNIAINDNDDNVVHACERVVWIVLVDDFDVRTRDI